MVIIAKASIDCALGQTLALSRQRPPRDHVLPGVHTKAGNSLPSVSKRLEHLINRCGIKATSICVLGRSQFQEFSVH